MKLVAEQIKVLREKRKELLGRRDEYREHLALHGRDMETLDSGGIYFNDYAEHDEYERNLGRIDEIERTLETGEVVSDRNFDQVDVGTRFTAQFDDGERRSFLLVDKDLGYGDGYSFVSLDSDFGKAAKGMKEGDHTVYTTSANGTEIGMTIEAIDRVKENYLHFLRENQAALDTTELGAFTESQKELASESLLRGEGTPEERRFLKRVVEAPAAKAPKDGTIGIGSRVTYVLLNPTTEQIIREVEFIDHALSSELACDYIEKTSPVGKAIFGLKANNSFMLEDGVKGMVISVNNESEKERVR